MAIRHQASRLHNDIRKDNYLLLVQTDVLAHVVISLNGMIQKALRSKVVSNPRKVATTFTSKDAHKL